LLLNKYINKAIEIASWMESKYKTKENHSGRNREICR